MKRSVAVDSADHLPPLAVRLPVYVSAGFFIAALILSAIFDPRIRVLHTLQALIYVAVIVLVQRSSAWGYGAGFWIATFWNYTNLFVTTFVKAGWGQLVLLMHTGQLQRPDLLVALLAAGGHFLMIAACVAGFAWLRPRALAWMQFVLGGLLAVGSFVLMIVTTGRQYVPLMRRVFHV